jgi:hypothetical protein
MSGYRSGILLPADIFKDLFPEHNINNKPNILYSRDNNRSFSGNEFHVTEHKINYQNE